MVFDGHVSDDELLLTERDSVIELRHRFRPHLARGQYHVEVWVHHNTTGTVLGWGSPVGAFRIVETQTHRSIADVELKELGQSGCPRWWFVVLPCEADRAA